MTSAARLIWWDSLGLQGQTKYNHRVSRRHSLELHKHKKRLRKLRKENRELRQEMAALREEQELALKELKELSVN